MTVEYPESVDLVVLGTGLVQAVVAWCEIPNSMTFPHTRLSQMALRKLTSAADNCDWAVDSQLPPGLCHAVTIVECSLQLVSCSAAARQGKSVLILDTNEFYGEAGATQSLPEFQAWLQTQAQGCRLQQSPPQQPSDGSPPTELPLGKSNDITVKNVDTWFRQEACTPGNKFCIDLAHQALESTGPCVHGIRDIALHNYLEFSAVTAALTLHEGHLCGIPASRADVHAASWLTAGEKRTLHIFLSAAQQAAAGSVSEMFQSSHFKAEMDEFGLPDSVQDGVLYSVYGADTEITGTAPLEGVKVLEAMVKYMAQSGVYVAGQAPFIELHYGSGEVSQAFVRNCCVHGGQVALGVHACSIVAEQGAVAAVNVHGGHRVACSALIGSFGYVSQLHDLSLNGPERRPEPAEQRGQEDCSAGDVGGSKYVARAIVAVSRPVLAHLTNCKIVIPPGECGNARTVTAWQCHSTLHCCPDGSVLLYLSMNAPESTDAKGVLEASVVALLAAESKANSSTGSSKVGMPADPGGAVLGCTPVSAEPAGPDAQPPEAHSSAKRAAVQEWPEVAFACFFTQCLPDSRRLQLPTGVACCSDVGACTEMDGSFLEAEEIFARLFPDVVFLTKAHAIGVDAKKDEEEPGDDLDKALKALGLV